MSLPRMRNKEIDRSRRKKPKRILMIVENWPYVLDARVRKEAEALTDGGYRVLAISPGRRGEPWRDVLGAVELYRFPVLLSSRNDAIGYLIEYVWATMWIILLSFLVLLRHGFDVIHVANPPDCIVPAMCFYKLIGKFLVYDQHDLCPELYELKFGRGGLLHRVLLSLERLSHKLADQVVVTNESYKKIAMERGGLAESKISVVRNGPDLKTYETSEFDRELRAKSPNIIAYAGVIGTQDGLDYLVRALHCLRYELGQESFLCLVLGDGDAVEGTKALAQELGVDDKVWFAGWVNDARVYARYLSTADICVAPDPSNCYNDHSTFIKVMEYMAVGKPIVAFDLAETQQSAHTAAAYARPNDVADFAQYLADLMSKPSVRQLMGQSGYLRVRNELAWEYSVPKLLGVYEKLGKYSVSSERFRRVAAMPRSSTSAGLPPNSESV